MPWSSARPKPSGPRWRMARAMRRSAASSTGASGRARTMPAIPHISSWLHHDRGCVQVGGRHAAAVDLAVGDLDLVGLESRARRQLAGRDVVLATPDEDVHRLQRVAEEELLLAL